MADTEQKPSGLEAILGRLIQKGRVPGFTASEQRQLLELDRQESSILTPPKPAASVLSGETVKPLTEQEKQRILLDAIAEHRARMKK